jgi:cytochrome b subunit of formate dehydrogenase
MGLDKDDSTPAVDFAKRTTQVNMWMVISIIVFFLVAGVVVWSLWPNPATKDVTSERAR